MSPMLPMKSVSSHVLELTAGRVKRLVEVVLVVDANGEVWRREGSTGSWQRVL